MARIFMSGAETRDFNEEGWIKSPGGAYNTDVVLLQNGRKTPQGNGGQFSWRFGTSATEILGARLALGNSYATLFGRFGFNMLSSGNGTTHYGDHKENLVTFLSGGAVICFFIINNPVTKELEAWNGSGVQLGARSSPIFVDDSIWRRCEFRISPAASGGRLEFWLDDVKHLDFTGGVAGPGGEVLIDEIHIGSDSSSLAVPGRSHLHAIRAFDDFVLNDATGTVNTGRPGDGYLIPLQPIDNGASSQLTNSHGNSGDNFLHVSRPFQDKDLPKSTGFVAATAAAQKDSYLMDSLPEEFGSIAAIKFSARSSKNGPAINNIRYAMTPNAQAEFQHPIAPGISLPNGALGWAESIIETNPNTTNPFTAAEMRGAESGYSLEA